MEGSNFLDPVWRLNNLYWIVDKDANKVLFKPNDTQMQFLQECGTRDIILKARQLGFTTLICLIALDECIFNVDWNAAIIAHKLDDAKKIFQTKVKYPYDRLPDEIRAAVPTIRDSADTLLLSNGSNISVTTSARSGTLQRLHVSEFGKICSIAPQRAREIVAGSLPAVDRGVATIESTAEGQEGRYYEMTEEARAGNSEWKFHFAAWWQDTGNVYDPNKVIITRQHREYFAKLRYEKKIHLSAEQQAWWVRTEQTLGGDMKRENPSTPEEAFEQAIEGAYFGTQLAHSDKFGLIGRYPHIPVYPVNTFWDLGRNDSTSIWLHQRVGFRNRFIGYYENSGEHVSHYINWLRDWAKANDAHWGEHYWPHDGDRQDLFLEHGRLGEVERLGFRPFIVDRPKAKIHAIDAARAAFASCDFDEVEAALGVKRLRHYRKEWDEARNVFRNAPRHDEASHGADAFMTFATGYVSAVDDLEDDMSPIPQTTPGEAGANTTTGY